MVSSAEETLDRGRANKLGVPHTKEAIIEIERREAANISTSWNSLALIAKSDPAFWDRKRNIFRKALGRFRAQAQED